MEEFIQNKAWKSFLEELLYARKRLSCDRNLYRGTWYRGVNDRWDLSPGIFRPHLQLKKRAEINLYHEFLIRSGEHIGNIKESWEILSLMQHSGIPTRLLDWTESLAVAIYFAIQEPVNPCIYVLNPFVLSLRATKKNFLYDLHDKDLDFLTAFAKGDWEYKLPIPIYSPWKNRNIHSQRGYFTIQGTDERPLNVIDKRQKIAMRVELPIDAIPAAREFLVLSGVDSFTLFPDLTGLSQYLKMILKDVGTPGMDSNQRPLT